MERVNPRSCGLDVHKASVTACIRVAQGEQVVQEIRTFGATPFRWTVLGLRLDFLFAASFRS